MFNPQMKQALLSGLTGESRTNMESAIETKRFFGVAIDTLCDGLTLGSTNVDGVVMPCVFATEDEAKKDLEADRESYQEDIRAGERDPDDVFEGEMVAIEWDGGETLRILTLDFQHTLKEGKFRDICGGIE